MKRIDKEISEGRKTIYVKRFYYQDYMWNNDLNLFRFYEIFKEYYKIDSEINVLPFEQK